MGYCDVSRKEFDRLFHKGNLGKWSRKTHSAPSCGLRLKWHRNDAESSLIIDDNQRVIAGESDILHPYEKLDWSCDKNARKGDLSLFYRTAPAMDIRYLLLAEGDVVHYPKGRWKWGCAFVVAYKFQTPLPLECIRQAGVYIRQSTAIPVAESDWRRLNEMLAERNPSYPDEVRENFGVDVRRNSAFGDGVVRCHSRSSDGIVAAERESDGEGMDASPPVAYERLSRPEQRQFRESLTRAYGGRCAVTGELTDVVLDASHLPGRDHTRHNRACDGILLRADLHRLLDAGLMTFDADGVVQISRDASPEYRKLHGRVIRFPKRKVDRPTL